MRKHPYAALASCLLLTVACTTVRVPPSTAASREIAGVGAMLSVERFLQAANAKDFEAMQTLFGSYEGPIKGDRRELELRMAAIAEILTHEDYVVVSEEREPGREHPTTRVLVTLTKGGRPIEGVPFLVVRTEAGGWLVEQVDLAYIMKG
jgi:hypothetical protein